MWPAENGTSSTPAAPDWAPFGFGHYTSAQLPVLVAVFCGGTLVVFILLAVIVYRCCVMPQRDKHGKTKPCHPPAAPQLYPSASAVFADPKSGQLTYSSRLISPIPGASGRQHWFYNNRIVGASNVQCTHCPGTCPVPRSSSHPGPTSTGQQVMRSSSQRKQRPVSQPIRFGPCDLVANCEGPKQVPMPEISEFSPQTVQYASSSILDEVGAKDIDVANASGSTNLKTRSLPAWVRSKPRPLSTEDDLADLYAKVNFSKKRKNRMRNDEAAIIALSKSRSQFLHKDTDSLVDNEAVIVYDERTAL